MRSLSINVMGRLLAVGVLLAVAALGGCHTVQGVGQDITAVGQAGQDMIDNSTRTGSRRRYR